MIQFKPAYLLLLAALVVGCGQNPNSPTDTATSGSIHIVADDAFKPLVDAEIKVFTSLYKDAHVQVKYETEDSVFKDLLASDSVRFAVAARKLTKDEEEYFHSKTYYPEQVKIATDAMALIVNNDNPDSLLTMDKVTAIFNGQDSTWKDVDSRSKLGKISVVFDHENSSNSRYIRDSIIHGKKFPAYCFAVHTNEQVIEYVNKNPGAMGVISANWISDNYDSTVMRFLQQVRVVGISKKESTNINDYYQPYLAYLKAGDYSLSRGVYVIKREARTGLGSGFLAFITADKGQRIVFRAGLLPATVPTEIIKY
ncbi:MAG TPA: substrate-binding domain-containing protein [Bacteroidia bacterium]|nr:substrate-binding domain-containing protein [Bacteroidia bacterium]